MNAEVYMPVNTDWCTNISQGHILIIALARDWKGLQYFTPSSWGHQVAGLAKKMQDLQKLEAASPSDWQEKS